VNRLMTVFRKHDQSALSLCPAWRIMRSTDGWQSATHTPAGI
jgi:hypothetical protein